MYIAMSYPRRSSLLTYPRVHSRNISLHVVYIPAYAQSRTVYSQSTQLVLPVQVTRL